MLYAGPAIAVRLDPAKSVRGMAGRRSLRFTPGAVPRHREKTSRGTAPHPNASSLRGTRSTRTTWPCGLLLLLASLVEVCLEGGYQSNW